MPRVGLEPTTYRFLAGILCHWDTEASLHAFSAHEHEWTGRDSNPQGRHDNWVTTSHATDYALPVRMCPSAKIRRASTLGGTRTHNTPRLKRLPLPLGHQGSQGTQLALVASATCVLDPAIGKIPPAGSGWRGTRTPRTRRQLVYSQRRYRLRAIHPSLPIAPTRGAMGIMPWVGLEPTTYRF